MRRAGSKYTTGTVSAHLSYRCCTDIPRYYKPMYDDFAVVFLLLLDTLSIDSVYHQLMVDALLEMWR